MMKKIFPCLSLFISLLVHSNGSLLAQTDSLDREIGQMLMIGMRGTSADSTLLQTIRNGKVGGILLYEYNLSRTQTRDSLIQLTQLLQEAGDHKLWISIDQEGGQVNRLKPRYGFPPMPSAYSLRKLTDPFQIDTVFKTIATTLSDCKINLNYAPVLDLHDSTCPVLGKRERCYSDNPEQVADMAQKLVRWHQFYGIQTAVKHFPGHGRSTTDSHLGLTDVSRTWKEDELIPYQRLIERDMIGMLMTAHIVNRKLDTTGVPATLSKTIITGLLRDSMKYKGVVITDDMQMKAISKLYGLEQSIQMAIDAGVDVLMFSNNIPNAPQYEINYLHQLIRQMVLDEKISRERIHESYVRIQRLKQTL